MKSLEIKEKEVTVLHVVKKEYDIDGKSIVVYSTSFVNPDLSEDVLTANFKEEIELGENVVDLTIRPGKNGTLKLSGRATA